MMNITIFIYELHKLGFSLWLENKQLKYRQYKELPNKEALISLIKNNKYNIIEFLKFNNWYSDNIVDQNHIFQSNNNKVRLSFAQERLWFIQKYEEGTSAYNIPLVFKLSEVAKLESLEKAIKSIILRHEILRTVIKQDNEGNSYQLVMDLIQTPFFITKVQVSNNKKLEEKLQEDMNHVFDLSSEYPIKVSIYTLDDSDIINHGGNKVVNINRQDTKSYEHYLSLVIHHIAFDGWSTDILSKELEEYYSFYEAQREGRTYNPNLPDLSIQYKDFALWQKSYLSGERLNSQLSYWKEKLDEYETISLVTDKLRPKVIDYTGDTLHFEIEQYTSLALKEITKTLKISLYSLLLAGYYLMLRSYTNQNDIVIGTPIANRHYSSIENLIGFFVNTLALRIKINESLSIKEFIESIGKEIISAQLNQDLPFEKLVEELNRDKDNSRHPIFQILFVVQDFEHKDLYSNTRNERGKKEKILETYIRGLNLYSSAHFDITTNIDSIKDNIKGSFNYATSLYKKETIERFIETYKHILGQIASLCYLPKVEQIKLSDLTYLTPFQYNQIIYTWNNTKKEYPKDKTINQLFEEQVAKTPDNIAMVYEDTKLTYVEFNEKANKLANYLIEEYKIKSDDLIALFLDRNEHMLIAIMAVLKAGGAYVPIDPNHPDDRIKYVLKDTEAKVILTNEIHSDRLKNINKEIGDSGVSVLSIDNQCVQNQLRVQSNNNLQTKTKSSNLAYVIYTSGTTGQPKGVMIEHKNLVNYAYAIADSFNFSSADIHLLIAEYIFDLGYTSLWGSILFGGELHVISKDIIYSPSEVSTYINKKKISVIKTTPLYFQSLIDSGDQGFLDKDNNIKIILGGEKLSLKTLNCLAENNNRKIKLYNHYGPTEITVGCITNNIQYQQEDIRASFKTNPIIGTPLANAKAYILSANLTPLPIGAIGELYVGGDGLARGYLNRPDLTKKKFIDNPFQTAEEKDDTRYGFQGRNARLYKTGDLVRWLPDGNIEYIGRNDFQVKIRGYRIELGEIENALVEHGDIAQAVVIAKEDDKISTKKLIAYIVPKEFTPTTAEIIDFLKNKLPEYMLPSDLVYLDKLPLTNNSKLDRKALPDPGFTNANNYYSPRNELETRLRDVWAEVLGLPADKIGIKDDFFMLGGDSIVSIQLISKIRKKLGINISIKNIFEYRTIEKLYDQVINENLSNSSIKEKDYWQNVLLGCEESYKRLEDLAVNENVVNSDSISLSTEETSKLLKEASKAYNTQINDLLLTALAYSLAKVTNSNENYITLEGHGREEINHSIDITKTVGWFTTMYPVKLEIKKEIGDSIKHIKESLRQIPNKGIGYGSIIGYENNLLPKISFNYLGQFNKKEKKQQEDNIDRNIININGSVIDGCLSFTIDSKLGQETANNFAKDFENNLKMVIKHCQGKDTTEYTMSDHKDFESYVIFNQQIRENNKTIFIFPPGEGGAESYFNNIVPELDNYKLILFNNYYNHLNEIIGYSYVNNLTYEQLAKEYITYIKTIQSKGPYNLLGWSFGGELAFEVAKQLTNNKDEVANIILIDTIFYKKSAVEAIESSEKIHNISYNYSPILLKKTNTNIILFKASRPVNDSLISYYYCYKTKCNHLTEAVNDNASLEIIEMPHDHYSWVYDKLQVARIADEIKSVIK